MKILKYLQKLAPEALSRSPSSRRRNNVLDESNLIPIREEVFDVTPKQRKFIDDIVDQKLIEHEVEISEYISNLQLEMMRQFLIQKEEILA